MYSSTDSSVDAVNVIFLENLLEWIAKIVWD